RNNRLRDVRIGDDMMKLVLATVNQTKGQIAGVLRSASCDANVLAGRASEYLAVIAALSHNVVKPDTGDAGVVIANQGKYIGNGTVSGVRFRNAGNIAEKFGNGALIVVDI